MAMKRIISSCVMIILLFAVTFGGGAFVAETRAADVLPVEERLSNRHEIILTLREGLRKRSAAITVRFRDYRDVLRECDGMVRGWMEEALAETEHPAEGDYIRYQYGGYTYKCSYEARVVPDGAQTERGAETQYHYTIRIVPEYDSFLAWEEQVDVRVNELMAGFAFGDTATDLQKIRTIYDYICENVTYDKVHAKNPYHTKRHTAYAALFQKTATCQGFCTALYRLLREADIDCRIVTGKAEDESLHAWVIVNVNGAYYLLDPSWDADGEDGYRYFLIGSEEDAGRHVPGAAFTTESFMKRHPLAEETYDAGSGMSIRDD